MNPLRAIVTGIDFSAGSATALRQAARIARANDATLCAFHAVPRLVVTELAESLGRDPGEVELEVAADARRQLAELVAEHAPDAGAELVVAVGKPLEETLETVRRREADLLVLGINGASGYAGGAGTFAPQCVRRAPARVLLVHETHATPYRTVVACVDFSETSRRALAEAVRVARADGAELHALHVYYGPWNILHYRAPTPEASPAFQRQYLARLRSYLDTFLRPFAEDLGDLAVHPTLVEHRSYGRGIVAYVREHDADLVVLGTEGRTGLRSLLLGSTAERVLRETPCSVLTIGPAEAGASDHPDG